MDILAVGAHPDDIELGAGGSLLRWMKDGHNVEGLVLCRPSAEVHPSRNQDIVSQELARAQALLGFRVQVYDTPVSSSGRPQLSWDNDTITGVDRLLRGRRFDLIITHHPGETHQDHVHTFRIVRSLAQKLCNEMWLMEIPFHTTWNTAFRPQLFVDISETFADKEAVLLCYASYIGRRELEQTRSVAQLRAQALPDAKFAEAFEMEFRRL